MLFLLNLGHWFRRPFSLPHRLAWLLLLVLHRISTDVLADHHKDLLDSSRFVVS